MKKTGTRTNKKGNQQSAQAKTSKKGNTKIALRVANISDDERKYEYALTKPFNVRARGAQVPDLYSFPTETVHVECTMALSTDNNGNLSFLYNPSLLYTLLVFNGSAVAGSNNAVDASYINSVNTVVTISGAKFYGATTAASLSSRYSDYRVVGAGLQIKPLVSYTNAPGKLMYSMTPSAEHTGPSLIVMSQGAAPTAANVAGVYGVPWDASSNQISSALLLDPVSGEISLTELIQKTNLEVSIRHSGPGAFEFRNTNNATINGYVISGDNVTGSGFNSTATSTNASLDSNALLTGGWSSFAMRGQGLVTNTAVLECRVVFHLEGSPTTGATVGLAGATSKVLVKPLSFFNVLARAANSPPFKMLASEAGNLAATAGMRALGILGGML